MTDGDALYRAIVARPEDDTPRLVYADWLEENGHEEEAEFIRLECRLEASTPDLPEYTELTERCEELRLWLQTYAPKKLRLPKRSLGRLDLSIGSSWWELTSRGFPWMLNVSQIELRLGAKGVRRLATVIEKAFTILPTRFLVVDFPAIEDLAEFLKQPVVSSIGQLSVSTSEQAGDDAARLIAECRLLRNLRDLTLTFPVGEAGANALAWSEHLARLEWLGLDTFQLLPATIRILSAGSWFRRLRKVYLADHLSAEAFEELCRLSPFPELHTLNLLNNSFPVSSWHTFARSKSFPKLTTLNLAGTDMSSGQMEALANAKNINLGLLDLSSCSIGNEGVHALVTAKWIDSLHWLDLATNRLGPGAVKRIAKCRKLSNLKYLALYDNTISGTGLHAIAGSAFLHNLSTLLLGVTYAKHRNFNSDVCRNFLEKLDLPKLRRLSLSGLPIDARSVRVLTDKKFRNLTRLELANCKLTDEAMPDLLTSPTLQGLIELNLQGNSLKAGVIPLTDKRILPRLSTCRLFDNSIPGDLYNKIARRRPGVLRLM